MPGFRPFTKYFRPLALTLCLLSVAVMPQPAVFAASAAQPVQPAAVSSATAKALADLDLPLPNVIVTTTALANDPSDGACDLWEALQAVFQANYGLPPTYHECLAKPDAMNIIGFGLNAMGGVITIPPSGDLSQLPMVHGNTVIVGPIAIQGSPNADTHILRTAPDAKLTVAAVSLKNTHTAGAGPAIYDSNYATINVVASFLTNNDADSDGGAIYSNGDLNLIGTSFIGNHTNAGAGRGGAVYMTGSGSFKSEGSTFTGNKANAGGAIYLEKASGDAAVNDSIFTGNMVSSDTSGLGGGALYNFSGKVEVQRSAFNANIALQGKGGALVNNSDATAVISNSLFDGSMVGDSGVAVDGGAVENRGDLTVGRSTFVSNSASGNGGAIDTGDGGKVTVFNATLTSNSASQAGGAIQITGAATAAIYNTTLSGNSAGTKASAINALGATQIGNTIIDHGASAASCDHTGITSRGHNLDLDGSCTTAPGDLVGMDPKLGGLTFNGGALPVLTTQKPAYDSPAADHGDPLICADQNTVNSEDETGTKRPKDANNTGTMACDIGAIELPPLVAAFNAMPLPPGPLNFGSVQTGQTQQYPLTVTNSGTYPLTLSGPNLTDGSHFSLATSFPVKIDAGSQATLTLICTSPAAPGPVLSDFSFTSNDPDKPNITYNLLCNGTAAPKPGFTSVPAFPAPIEFGNVIVGLSAAQTLTVTNIGKVNLDISSAVYTGSNGIGLTFTPTVTVAPGAFQTIPLTCTPTAVGLLTGQVTLTTNDPAQPNPTFKVNCGAIPPPSAYLSNTLNLTTNEIQGLTEPMAVAFSADSQNAYITSNYSNSIGQLTVLKRITQSDGTEAFAFVNHLTGGSTHNARSVAVSPNDKYVILAGTDNNELLFYQRNSSTGSLSYLGIAQNSQNGVTGLLAPREIAFSPDSRYAYIVCSNSNDIVIFKQDDHASLKFTFLGTVTSTYNNYPLTNPNSIAISPDGKNAYVTTANAGTSGILAVYRRDAISGALLPTQTRIQGDVLDCSTCLPLNGLQSVFKVVVSPDGGNVYVTASLYGNLSTYIRDPATGEVHWPFTFVNGQGGFSQLTDARGVAVSPDGRHVYALGAMDNSMIDFGRDLATHFILPIYLYQKIGTGAPKLGGSMNVAASNDGKFVMVTANSDNAVAVFQVANPKPALFVLEPASVTGNANDVKIVVKGAGFVSGAKVKFDGAILDTFFVNSGELDAIVKASQLAGAQTTHNVNVNNPVPGGGDSFNALPFVVIPAATAQESDVVSSTPIPSVDHLTPGGVKAGSAGLIVDVYGTNFQSDASVFINTVNQTTTFVDSTHLQTTLSATQVAQAGTVSVMVRNGTNSYSNKVGLTVSPPGQNPVPSLVALNPSQTFSRGASSPSVTVTVIGSNFVDGSIVQWNGNDRQTTFIDSTHLAVTLTGSDFLWPPSSNGITVRTPAPGGGTSNVLTFQVQTTSYLYLPTLKR
jgi:6-phosphogluconolactonase (cycloisomerase 2 family)